MMTSSISGTAAQNEGKFTENFDDLGAHGHAEPESSLAGPQQSPVQRKESLSKKLSIRRAVSKRSADSHLVNLDEDSENINSVFVIPVPTQANPTEILAERFNGEDNYSSSWCRQALNVVFSLAPAHKRLCSIL